MASFDSSRRRLLAGMAAAIATCHAPRADAQAFPSRNMRVVVPTGQGGGADRLARVFDDFWGPLLKTSFEYGFYPGAAGQVGYELYLNRREKDGHNLLFGNMGPEMIMYALAKPSYRFPQDYQYFCRLDVDDSVLFVRRESPFRRIEDVVAAAKKRTVSVAVSRLPHPASIGVLALGEATKAKFNLVPYAGGNPTSVAVMNGEADCGALPIAGVVAIGDQMRILGVFNDDNTMGRYTNNAPSVNAVFGTQDPRALFVALVGDPCRGDRKAPGPVRAAREDGEAGFRQSSVPRSVCENRRTGRDHPVRRSWPLHALRQQHGRAREPVPVADFGQVEGLIRRRTAYTAEQVEQSFRGK